MLLDHPPGHRSLRLVLMLCGTRSQAGEKPEFIKPDRIYVYCRTGNRAAQAIEILEERDSRIWTTWVAWTTGRRRLARLVES